MKPIKAGNKLYNSADEKGSVLLEYFALIGVLIVALIIAVPQFGDTVSRKIFISIDGGCGNYSRTDSDGNPWQQPIPPENCRNTMIGERDDGFGLAGG